MYRRPIISAVFVVAAALSACAGSDASPTTPAVSTTDLAVATTTDSTTTTEAAPSDAASGDGQAAQHAFEAEHFEAGAIVGEVTTEDCTLSGGTVATCVRVTVAGFPSSYEVGPFCPETITTPAEDAGIWFDGAGVYDLDGPFIAGLADFYDDDEWRMYDSDGNVNITDTEEAFDGAARPDVDPAYQNHCVEGRLEWLDGGVPVETTVLIPLQPVRAASASSSAPGNFGVTLDGIVIAASAPVDAILGAHTIAAFDDCGGHYNPAAGYHLHGAMGCGHLEEDDVDGETAMFGYAMDGYPIHLPLGAEALASAGLDECNGHSTASEGYHYHANSAAENAVLPCLMGEYVSSGEAGGPPQGGAPGDAGTAGAMPDLSSAAAELGVTLHELEDALGGGPNSDLATVADLLGVSVAELEAALPPRPDR